VYDRVICQSIETKFNVQILKNCNNNWKLKCESLEFKMKTFIESIKTSFSNLY